MTWLHRKKKGFTLIELLVVIAIIAILATILFPVFERARDEAMTATCQSNLKQLSLSLLMYGQDYDERMPQLTDGGTPANIWCDVILPYVKNKHIFDCPAFDHRRAKADCPRGYLGDPQGANAIMLAYGMNRMLNYSSSGSKPWGTVRLAIQSRIKQPARCILLADTGQGYTLSEPGFGAAWNTYSVWAASGFAGYSTGGVREGAHSDGANVSFCDGHAKWFRPTVLYNNPSGAPGDNLYFDPARD